MIRSLKNTRWFGGFIVLTTIFNLLLAARLGLYADEAYYFAFSKQLDWGYLDHPPMVALMIGLGNVLSGAEWGIRIVFVAAVSLTYLVLFKLVRPCDEKLFVLVCCSFFPLHLFGFMALPDVPIFFFTAVFFLFYQKYLTKDTYTNAIFLGICIACMLYSKYHGLLVVFFVLISNLKLFQRKSFYLIIAIALLVFLPHLIWQYRHEFSSLRYHFIDRSSAGFSLKYVGEYLLSFLFFNGPLTFAVLMFLSLWFKAEDKFDSAMKFTLFGFIIFFFITSFKGRVEANWTSLCIVPVLYISFRQQVKHRKLLQYLSVASIVLIVGFRIHLMCPFIPMANDRAKEFYGHREFAEEVKKQSKGLPIVANRYQEAAILSYYLKEDVPALNLGGRKNQYDFWDMADRLENRPVAYISAAGVTDSAICHPKLGCFELNVVNSLQVVQYPDIYLEKAEVGKGWVSMEIMFSARNHIDNAQPLMGKVSIQKGAETVGELLFEVAVNAVNDRKRLAYSVQVAENERPDGVAIELLSGDGRPWRKKAFKLKADSWK